MDGSDTKDSCASEEAGSGMCKAGFADDDAPRVVEDGSGACKAGFADDDALRAVDGSSMCKPWVWTESEGYVSTFGR